MLAALIFMASGQPSWALVPLTGLPWVLAGLAGVVQRPLVQHRTSAALGRTLSISKLTESVALEIDEVLALCEGPVDRALALSR